MKKPGLKERIISIIKPILGGKNIIETDEQMIQRFKNQNKEAVESLRKNKGSINSLKEALMKTDNPFSDLVKTTKKGPKSLEQRRKEAEEALRNKNVVPIKDPKDPQKFYQGGQAQIEPDLSGIGHGSDALMARNMLIAPGSQATTSTGLNYLLGEDNDTVRVPYNDWFKKKQRILELMLNEKMSYEDALKEFENRMKQQPYIDERFNMGPGPILEAAEGGRIGYKDAGPVVLPQPKPAADPMVELQRIYDLYKKSMPGVSQETQKYLQQDFIQKLNEANISQEQFMSSQMQNNFAEGGPARQNFGMGKRAFLKLIGSGVAGIAGLKTGLLGFGKKEVAKKAATELATSAGSEQLLHTSLS